jgi:uncharacterized protein (DUF305 family)
MLKPLILATSFSVAVLGAAVAQTHDMSKMMMMKPGAEMSEADKGYMAAMQKMQDEMMKTEMTGNPSGDFARMMIPHHQSAIDMTNALLAQENIDPEMKAMAEKMRDDQKKEIADMQRWLEAHPE